MALAIDGQFDHRRVSAERLINEAASWGVLGPSSIEQTIRDTVQRFEDALNSVRVPAGVSEGLVDGLEWNVTRLAAGLEISRPRR